MLRLAPRCSNPHRLRSTLISPTSRRHSRRTGSSRDYRNLWAAFETMIILLILLVTVLALAYANGTNDNFKGVATLFGSGTCNYQIALVWATITTLAGSLLALILAHGLVDAFKGKGLVPDAVTVQPTFLLAVSLGAALTVLLATWVGMPISTTHALTGALVGAGLVAAPGGVKFSSLGTAFVLPLLCSPLIALTLTIVIYPLFRTLRRGFGVSSASCICVGTSYQEVRHQPDGTWLC